MHTLLSPLLLLLAFSGCAASGSSLEPAEGSGTNRSTRPASTSTDASALGAMLPRPKQSFTLRVTSEQAPSLYDAVVELEKATGVHFVVSDEARKVLRASTSGLLSDMEIPPSEAWRVVETMLAQNELVLVPSRGAEPVTIALTSALERGGHELKGYAVPIDASAIEECVDHPAVIFSTVIDIHPMDARQMSTSMRQLFPDQRTQSILPLDGSQLMLTGFGPQLLTSVRMMQESAAGRRKQLDAASNAAAPTGSVSPQ